MIIYFDKISKFNSFLTELWDFMCFLDFPIILWSWFWNCGFGVKSTKFVTVQSVNTHICCHVSFRAPYYFFLFKGSLYVFTATSFNDNLLSEMPRSHIKYQTEFLDIAVYVVDKYT